MSTARTETIDYTAVAAAVLQRCDILATFTEEPGRITRTFLSPPMHDVHRALRGWMGEAGLTVHVDAIGTILGESDAPADAPVFLIGSHLDTVLNAGRYDGILGVMLSIAAAEILHRSGTALPFALHVAGFSEEEGVRFPPYISSRALAGAFDPALLQLRDDAGKTLPEAITDFGLDPSAIPDAAYPPGRLLGYAEVHIEQGPRLESMECPVAAVEAIVGQSRMLLRVRGSGGHAGAYPMSLRRDAMTGAAEIILAIEAIARAADDLVATVGYAKLSPNLSNVIPDDVELSLDMRHKDDAVRLEAVAEIKRRAEEIAASRGLHFTVEIERQFPPVPMDAALTRHMQAAAQSITGGAVPLLTSGGGHDAAILSTVTPATMLFVRSPGGISHHPDESVLPGDVEVALRTLVEFVRSITHPQVPSA